MNVLTSILCFATVLGVYYWSDKNIRELGGRWNKKTTLLFFLAMVVTVLGLFDAIVFAFKAAEIYNNR